MATHQPIAAALSRLKTPLFLARSGGGNARPLISLYTTDRRASRDLARRATAELAGAGIAADCRAVYTSPRKLRRRSVEAMAANLGRGEIVYDPTGLVTRSNAVVACAAEIRRGTQAPLKGLYLNPDRRTLFVIVDEKAFPAGNQEQLKKRVEAMAEIGRAVQAWRNSTTPDFELAIRIGFELPANVPVIAVDQRSVRSPFSGWQRRGIAAAIGSLLGFGALAGAQAADIVRPPPTPAPVIVQTKQPAVARPNFDILFAGVFLDGEGFDNFKLGAVGLKAAVPVGQQFGFQLDAAVGTEQYWGIGGHFFWRDPSTGLLGAFASHETLAGANFDRYGAEGEIYWNKVTLRGEVGAQGGDAPHSVFGGLDLTFYATPNFSLTAGGNRENDAWKGHLGLEWQPEGLSGLSVFADGDFGASNYVKAIAGVSFHFGTRGVSLIDRNRKYDPIFGLFHFVPKPAGYTPPAP